MELEARIATVRMAETFVISRGASDEAEVLDVELRHELPRLGGRQFLRGHAERVLQRERRAEGCDVCFAIQQKEVAVLAERDLVGHCLELGQRAERDPDVELVGELRADTARRFARGTRSECVPLEQHDVFDAEPAQVEGGGGAEGAATDYYDVGRASGRRSGACRTAASRRSLHRPT